MRARHQKMNLKSNLSKDYFKSNKIHHAILIHNKKGTCDINVAFDFVSKITGEKKIDISKVAMMDNIVILQNSGLKQKIEIDEIENAITQISFRSDKLKFFIIQNMNDLSDYAINKVLKTTEEPPIGTYIIALSSNIYNLPKTLLSRFIKFEHKNGMTNIDINEKDYKEFIINILSGKNIKLIIENCVKENHEYEKAIYFILHYLRKKSIDLYHQNNLKLGSLFLNFFSEFLNLIKAENITSIDKRQVLLYTFNKIGTMK